jgi:pimeloyl-ACP methyl ester carboxylesterase
MLRLAVTLASLVLAASAAAGQGAAPPKLSETCLTPAERALAVFFRAPDGTRLAGVLLGHGSRAVLLAHELGADLCSWLPYGRTLVTRGYRVLAIDFRGSGSSGQSPARVAGSFDRDVVAGVKLLKGKGARRVVLAGGSIGGAAVLVAAAAIDPRVDGVVSVSAPATVPAGLGPNALAAVGKLRVPALFVTGKLDPIVPLTDARRLYRAAGSGDKRLVILPGSSHGSALLLGSDGARARGILDGFIDAHTRG